MVLTLARRRRLGEAARLGVPRSFVEAPDPAAVDEPAEGRPEGDYVWRGALPESARVHEGSIRPPCAGWLLRECSRGAAAPRPRWDPIMGRWS